MNFIHVYIGSGLLPVYIIYILHIIYMYVLYIIYIYIYE